VSGIQVITGIGVIPMILTQIHYKKIVVTAIEVEIPRGRIGLNYLSKFVCTKWAI
jgi:hypothetical protein